MTKITILQIVELSKHFDLPVSKIRAIIKVESGGIGFDQTTGKLIIQFEPHWFKRKSPYTPSGKWSLNKVERQAKEWEAFNDAFKLNPNATMESTSIGMMQVMGFHFKRLGFANVGEMYDFAKISEKNQIWLGLEFLRTDKVIYTALKKGDWKTVALRYNGVNYHILGYDKKLIAAEKLYL